MTWRIANVTNDHVEQMQRFLQGTKVRYVKNRVEIQNISGFGVSDIVNLAGKYFLVDFTVDEISENDNLNLTMSLKGANASSTQKKISKLFGQCTK